MQIIITSFVQSVNNRRNQLGNREPEMAQPVIQMTSCSSSVSSSLLLLLMIQWWYLDESSVTVCCDFDNKPSSRNLRFYMVVERGRNWAFTPKSYYHPFRVRSLHPFSQTSTYQCGTIVESRRGPMSSRKRLLLYIIVLATPTFSLSTLLSYIRPLTYPSTSHTNTHTLPRSVTLYFCVVRKIEFRIGGGTEYIGII